MSFSLRLTVARRKYLQASRTDVRVKQLARNAGIKSNPRVEGQTRLLQSQLQQESVKEIGETTGRPEVFYCSHATTMTAIACFII